MLAPMGPRQRWLRLLALSEVSHLERCWHEQAKKPSYDWIRRPETGLIMVRARVAGVGQRFNFGEMTATRCALRLDNGAMGIAHIAGRDHRHAELASLFDALLQGKDRFDALNMTVLVPIELADADRRRRTERRVLATKVDFFAQTST